MALGAKRSTSDQQVLRLGLPKGSLQESIVALFNRAGYGVRIAERSYYPTLDDPDFMS